jgi:hypothetical protein
MLELNSLNIHQADCVGLSCLASFVASFLVRAEEEKGGGDESMLYCLVMVVVEKELSELLGVAVLIWITCGLRKKEAEAKATLEAEQASTKAAEDHDYHYREDDDDDECHRQCRSCC